MKIFKLKEIVYRNLLAVGSEPITINLQKSHKTLVTGSNGAGKSTLIEAITYALFGKPFRKIKLGQLINSVNKKDLWVQLTMEYDNHEYIIRRGQKPAVFEIIRDGVPLDSAASTGDFQAQFEEMIGMNYNSYKQVVVLGTAGYTPFMDLGAPARRKLVEDLLEVAVLAQMDKLNKDQIKEVNAKLSETDLRISHTQAQTQTLMAADERQQKLSGDNVARLEEMLDDVKAQVEQLKSETLELNEEILKTILPEDVYPEIQTLAQRQAEVETQQRPLARVLQLYDKGGHCPICVQELSDRSKIGHIETSLHKLKTEFDELSPQIEQLKEKRQAYETAKQTIQQLESKIDSNKRLAAQHIERGKKIQAALAEAKKDFVDNSKEIAALKDSQLDLVGLKGDLAVEKHRRTVITAMLKDSGIKSAVFAKYVPIFNRQINYYLNLLSADYSFTLDEEFNETIKSRGRENFSYSSFSQGEKGRIDLALMFTWRDIAERISGIKISCLILDEVFDSALDAYGAKNISTVLNTMTDTNVFIISHRDHNPEDYGQWLQMKKVGRYTVLEK
ncbi:SbcC-like subunit of palindrome specific endonuclease [Acinetobacter phage Acj9]|uniref:Gp46 recombination endonuclease subunit n=1 Tax=Acinetobacter phage Acj9 TaxID=760939 RepID=E5EPP5_9CAUD|nr:SbcC-like subunit of palindrome specific endonuclease [Acinetobacter phage Acj9]ADG60011.1 gp46 recombination endonuclease subunit [Acinetobacter phage Acj9]